MLNLMLAIHSKSVFQLLPDKKTQDQKNQESNGSPEAADHVTKSFQMPDFSLILRFPAILTGHGPNDTVPVNNLLAGLCFFQFPSELGHFSFHIFLCVPKNFIFRFQISDVLHGLLVDCLSHTLFLLILRHFVQIHSPEPPSIYPDETRC